MRGAQKKPDLIEGIACACAVTGRVLLDAAAYLTWGVAGELDDMKGIQDAGGVLELVINGVLAVPGRDLASRSGYRSESLLRALLASSHARCQTCLGPGPLKRAVGCSSPRVRSTMPVSSRGPSSASVLVVPHVLVNSQHPNPRKTGGVIRCGLQTRLDMGPHGVPRGCQLSSQSCDGGSFEAQLSDRPADRPHTQTRPGCAHPLVMFQERHRLAGAFAAHPAPYCATGSLPEPRPRARRSPPPPCARGLVRSPRIQGSQHSDHRTLCRARDHTHVERQRSDGSPPNRRAEHTDRNDQATHSSR